jgi:hypothetical protein
MKFKILIAAFFILLCTQNAFAKEVKVNTSSNVMVLLTEASDHITGMTGLTLTVTESKNGGVFADASPSVTEQGYGWYNLALTSTATNTVGDLVIHISASGADPGDLKIDVVTATSTDVYNAEGSVTSISGSAALSLWNTQVTHTDESFATYSAAKILSNLYGMTNGSNEFTSLALSQAPTVPAPDNADISTILSIVNRFVFDTNNNVSAYTHGGK